MLSLVSTKENGNGPMAVDKNGAVLIADESDPAESMESLVWLKSWKGTSFVKLLKTELFWGLFCQTLGYTITQLLFYTDKSFDIYFLPFYVLMVSYWAFAPLFISQWNAVLPSLHYLISVTAYNLILKQTRCDIPWQQMLFLVQYSERLCYDSEYWVSYNYYHHYDYIAKAVAFY